MGIYKSDIKTKKMSQSGPATFGSVVAKFSHEYIHNTPKKLKLVDAYLTYVFFTGVIQFLYCCLVGTFPFNAFLSGFISCVRSFILGVCLRLQVNIVKINLNSVPKLFCS